MRSIPMLVVASSRSVVPKQGGNIVYPAISVLIPLHNAENSIARTLHDVVEIVGDLNPSFEILLVDDGSTDDTSQVLVELAREFPQVSAISSRQRRGFVQAVQAGLEMLTGDVVFIQDGAALASPDAYRKLWLNRDENSASLAPTPNSVVGDKWLGRLVEWGVQISGGICRVDVPSGLQMIRRRGRLPMRAIALEGNARRHRRTDPATSAVLVGLTDAVTDSHSIISRS